MSEENMWVWKDIRISRDLVGETIKKGTGTWEKEYTYIKIPTGHGYDNYCFLLSDNCVHINPNSEWYISICFDMKIELIYDPEKKEAGARHKRYKLTGTELFEQVFKEYEVNFKKESEERQKKEASEKEKRDRANIGKVIAGRYEGNIYCDNEPKYMAQKYITAFFRGNNNSTYCNSKFQKVQNVEYKFEVIDNISRYHFLRYENIINAYLGEIDMLIRMKGSLRHEYMCKTDRTTKNKMSKWERKRYEVVTGTEDIIKAQLDSTEEAIEEIKKRMRTRISELLEVDKENEKLREKYEHSNRRLRE